MSPVPFNFAGLPIDIIKYILSKYLDPAGLYVCRFVCKQFLLWLPLITVEPQVVHLYKRPHYIATIYGYQNIVEWIYKNIKKWKQIERNRYTSKKTGIVHIQMTDVGPVPDYTICWLAAKYGHIRLLQWALLKNFQDSPTCRLIRDNSCSLVRVENEEDEEELARVAAEHGHLHILQWLSNCGINVYTKSISLSAFRGGFMSVIRWLHEECPLPVHVEGESRCVCERLRIDRNFNIAVLEFIKNKGVRLCDNVATSAIYSNRMDILEWFCGNGGQLTSKLYMYAACHGNIKMLELLYDKSCPWDETCCEVAICRDNIDILEWLRDHGCLWNERTCAAAARDGFLANLQWARAHGCPWDHMVLYKAQKYARHELYQWALENGAPQQAEVPAPPENPIQLWLFPNGAPQ